MIPFKTSIFVALLTVAFIVIISNGRGQGLSLTGCGNTFRIDQGQKPGGCPLLMRKKRDLSDEKSIGGCCSDADCPGHQKCCHGGFRGPKFCTTPCKKTDTLLCY